MNSALLSLRCLDLGVLVEGMFDLMVGFWVGAWDSPSPEDRFKLCKVGPRFQFTDPLKGDVLANVPERFPFGNEPASLHSCSAKLTSLAAPLLFLLPSN